MQVIDTITAFRAAHTALSGSLGFVPTMGYLHDGHVELIRHAADENDHVAVSIFVNPTQFGPNDDFSSYPRDPDHDLAVLREANIDLVFMPTVEEMYPPNVPDCVVDLPSLSTVLEGKHRPGHFKGVCQVVAKLFNVCRPNVAFFGQKDYQQLRILQAMAEALNYDVEVVGRPTVRDADGLAMSSRNQYLSSEERERALSISRALFSW